MKKQTKTLTFLSITICVSCLLSVIIPFRGGAGFDEDGQLHHGNVVCGRVYSIQSMIDPSRYIDVTNALTDDGSNVWTYPYNGAACQEWEIVEASDAAGEYMIKDMNSGKYLSIIASSSAEGANAWIWHDDGTSGQRFHITYSYGSLYKFLTKCSGYTKALAVDPSTHNVYQTDSSSGRTYFYLEDSTVKYGIPSGSGYLQNCVTSRFLTKSDALLTPNKIVQKNLDSYVASNELEFVYLGGGYYRIDLNSSKCLTVKNNNISKGLQAASYSGATGQMWKVTKNLDCITISPKCGLSYYLSSDSSNSGHNSELILSSSASSYSKWMLFSTENISDETDLTIISFNDDSHTGCAGHLDSIDEMLSSFSTALSQMRSVYVGYNEDTFMSSAQFSSAAGKSKLLFTRTHGNADSNGPYMVLNSIDLSGGIYGTRVTYHYDDLPDMSACDCAFFFTCHSADGSYNDLYADNFLTYAVDSAGAWAAIGFDGNVHCDYGEMFTEKFVEGFVLYDNPFDAFEYSANDDIVKTLQHGTDFPVFISDAKRIIYNSMLTDTIHNFR